jgi:predicted nucleic acid-binding protein
MFAETDKTPFREERGFFGSAVQYAGIEAIATKVAHMRVLIDTNIVIHRECNHPINNEVGKLFLWIDNLHYSKCVHPATVAEIDKLGNQTARESMKIKLANYNVLRTVAPLCPEIAAVALEFDTTDNDTVDTQLINEVFSDRVDFLITEDRKLHRKAERAGIGQRVFTIDDFLEKIIGEHPTLVDYPIPSVSQEYFGNIDVQSEFFDSFRGDYKSFDRWFNKKSDQIAYLSRSGNEIVAFLYLKVEDESEPYCDITPAFRPAKRLKVGSLKVRLNGFKIGERFVKIIFDNALRFNVHQIYITIFRKRIEQDALVNLLADFGFVFSGTKESPSGKEEVYVRDLRKPASQDDPRVTYPFLSGSSSKFVVPIYPDYHTKLFPDSILRTESPLEFVEHEPFRNAIVKAYVSRSWERKLDCGDGIVFYRTGGYYKGVATTLGIVENVVDGIRSFDEFALLCGKRSVFDGAELRAQWDYNPRERPFVVNFLYAYSFPKRPNLAKLIELGVIHDIKSVPRGFQRITEEAFRNVIRSAECNQSIIID